MSERIKELETKLEIVKEKCAYMKPVPVMPLTAARLGPKDPFEPTTITDEWLDEEYRNSKTCPECQAVMVLAQDKHWCTKCDHSE